MRPSRHPVALWCDHCAAWVDVEGDDTGRCPECRRAECLSYTKP